MLSKLVTEKSVQFTAKLDQIVQPFGNKNEKISSARFTRFPEATQKKRKF